MNNPARVIRNDQCHQALLHDACQKDRLTGSCVVHYRPPTGRTIESCSICQRSILRKVTSWLRQDAVRMVRSKNGTAAFLFLWPTGHAVSTTLTNSTTVESRYGVRRAQRGAAGRRGPLPWVSLVCRRKDDAVASGRSAVSQRTVKTGPAARRRRSG